MVNPIYDSQIQPDNMNGGDGNTANNVGQNMMPNMMPEESKQELLSLIEAIRQKQGEFNAMSFASKNTSDRERRELLRMIFERMQLAGIDLTDRESVAEFINDLRQINPEVASAFEEAMNAMLGEEDVAALPQEEELNPELDESINIGEEQDENLSENI